MSDQEETATSDAHQVFLDLLQEAGFFQQINTLEESLKIIAGQLKVFSENVEARTAETESLAAHMLACESILAVLLKSHPIAADDLRAEIKDRTAAMSGHEDGSPTVHALAMEILEKV